MADKAVSELIAATQVNPSDLFVLEQSGTAKKLTGQVLENWLVSFADGHGGIQSIEKTGTSNLVDTYRITLADTTTFDFVVNNGRGISSITKTSTAGLVDTYSVKFNDGSSSTFTVTNGAKGDKGDNAYLWVKYASQQPTASSHSFGDVPDTWIGIYYGTLASAPSDWQLYQWFQWKGEKGDTGEPAILISATISYQAGTSGTNTPSGTWLPELPNVPQGQFLWTKIVQQFNTGNPITAYSVSRMGLDGLGSIVTVNNKSPDLGGNVTIDAESVHALDLSGGTMEGSIDMGGQKVLGLGTPTSADEATTKNYVDSKHMVAMINLLASGWSSAAPYKQTIVLAGILATDRPHYGVVYSDNWAAEKEAFALVDDLDTANNSVTFTCFEEKPSTNITIQLEVNR